MTLEEFSAQFDPEEIEIAIITSMCKTSGTSAQGYNVQREDHWIAFIPVIAWQDLSSGEIHEEKITLIAMGAKAKDLKKHIKANSIIKIKVQKSCEGFEKCFRFVEKTGGGRFPELKKIKKTMRKELAQKKINRKTMEAVCYNDEILGEFKFCHTSESLKADILWLGDEIVLSVPNENEEKIKSSIGFLRELVENQNEWDKQICEYAADSLIETANDWNEDHEISKNEFKNRIALSIISIDSDGNFEFWFDDDNIFLGHSVMIGGDLKCGPSYVDIPG